MKNIFFLFLFLFSITLESCVKSENDIVKEDYDKLIKIKGADKLPKEPGVFFNCFPKEPGDIGTDISNEFKIENGNEYNIELNFYNIADIHDKQDPHNYTTLIIQYLDENNTLVIDTIYDGKDCISKKERNGKIYYNSKMEDRTYSIKKKSGDILYFAIFNSPYGKVDFSSEFLVNGEYEDFLSDVQYKYNLSKESFHVTDKGVDYLIYSKAVYLP